MSEKHTADTYAALVLAACGGALTLTCLIYAGRGLDLTDEGYYLNAMRNPQLYGALTTQAGVVYHSLFTLIGGDIWGLRAVNIAGLYGLSCLLIWQCLWRGTGQNLTRSIRVGLIFGGGTCVFFAAQFWLLTPSYNWLTLQALLATAIAASIYLRTSGSHREWAAFSIGICTGLCVLAKPTSGVVLSFLVVTLLGLRGALDWRNFALAAVGGVSTGVLGLLAISGGIGLGVAQLRFAAENTQIMGGGYSLAEMLTLSRPRHLRSLCEAGLLLGALTLITFWNRWAFAAALSLLGLVSVAAVLGVIPLLPPPGATTGLLMALALAALIGSSLKRQSQSIRQHTRNLAWPLFLSALPFAYAFGSNNSTWDLASSVAVFWLAALIGVVGQAPQLARWGLGAVAMGMILSGLRLDAIMQTPYRQNTDIRAMHSSVEALPGLRLGAVQADYLNALTKQAGQGGFAPQTPMIDITGRSPGALFVLRALPLGAPWLIGAYPGSDLMAKRNLARHDCELLARAWLLHEPNGPRALTDTILTNLGLPLPSEYTQAAQFLAAPGGYPRQYQQNLLRPTDPSASQKSCETLRAQQEFSR